LLTTSSAKGSPTAYILRNLPLINNVFNATFNNLCMDPRHELKLLSLGLTENASRLWHDDKLLGLYVSLPPFSCLVCCSLFRVILKEVASFSSRSVSRRRSWRRRIRTV